jgi:signal transduction histidine kinase
VQPLIFSIALSDATFSPDLVGSIVMRRSIIRVAVALTVLWASTCYAEVELRPRSILVLDQSELRGPFYYQLFSGLREVVSKEARSHTTLYAENLDLSRFSGAAYEQSLQRYLREKYQDRKIGVVVAVGAATLELVLRWRAELWPETPVVFALVDEMDFARLKPPPDVTGKIVKLGLADSITVARAVVPELKTIALVGDQWDRQVIFRNWKDELPTAAAGLNVVEIIGQTMQEIRSRVAELPEDSVILYSAVYSDGKGTFYPPATALGLIAEKANRPIVVAAETFLSPGGIGGYVLIPSLIGADAARQALRILDGEQASSMPAAVTGAVKPIFNWRQMQRWKVNPSDLPVGSEIRFREPTFWERYRWQSIAIGTVMLAQTVLIAVLLHERRKRHDAEVESRHRMSELAHVNRQATAGELSSSITHELKQPLGSILTNTETAELILSSPSPDLTELKEILEDIRRDDLRANEVIRRMRGFLKWAPFETKEVDLNELAREAFEFLSIQASARNVALYLEESPENLRVRGDPVQLQQVIVNLVVNSIDAMANIPYGRTVIGRTEKNGGASAEISISDSGPGIPQDKLNHVFDPFFTTKEQGMGMGLSIARTIVQAHQGRIWAEHQAEGGAVFRLSLPLAIP